MKTFNEFQESVAVLKGSSKLIPALMTGIGAAGTIMQARKKRKIGAAEKRLHQREMGDRSNDMIRARRGEADKQNKLIDKYERKQNEKNSRKNMIKGIKGGEVIQEDRKTFDKYMKDARGKKAEEKLPLLRKATKIHKELSDEDKK